MVKTIRDLAFKDWHEQWVRDASADLQKRGFDVIRINRVQRMKFIWGENITEIYYQPKEGKDGERTN